jgi:hypothetical protein
MDQKNGKKKLLNEYIKYSGIAMQMVVTFCLATWGGLKLDEHFQVKSHIITIFLLLFAVVSSIYFVIKSVTK